MTAATATATKDAKGASIPKAAKSLGELAPMEAMNAALGDAWEQLGIFKKIQLPKAMLINLCNLEGMPLSGVDVIQTQQGLKLYINGEGAKYNRDKYLNQQDREVAGRQIEVVPYDKCPLADATRDKAMGRVYFRTITKVKSPEYVKIINGIAEGKVSAEVGERLLQKIEDMNTYSSWSAFSNMSESFTNNRQPDHILKKGMTQAHRRADLEISKQCVLPMDEEPVDAEFVVRGTNADDAAKKATEAAGAGGTKLAIAEVKTTPDKPQTQAPAQQGPAKEKTAEPTPPAKAASAPGPAGEGEKKTPTADDMAMIQKRVTEINAVFDKAGVKKADRVKWFTSKGYPINKNEMTVVILDKALLEVTKEFIKTPAEPAQEAPVEEAPKEKAQEKPADPERSKALSSIFGHREKSGFQSEDEVREWVKTRWGKGLSEMDAKEVQAVDQIVRKLSELLTFHNKWGFNSPLELVEYCKDTKNVAPRDMELDALVALENTLNELV